MELNEIDKGYEGYSIYCGGLVCKYHEHEWIEWNKRTRRIAIKTSKKEEFLNRIKRKEKIKKEQKIFNNY